MIKLAGNESDFALIIRIVMDTRVRVSECVSFLVADVKMEM